MSRLRRVPVPQGEPEHVLRRRAALLADLNTVHLEH